MEKKNWLKNLIEFNKWCWIWDFWEVDLKFNFQPSKTTLNGNLFLKEKKF